MNIKQLKYGDFPYQVCKKLLLLKIVDNKNCYYYTGAYPRPEQTLLLHPHQIPHEWEGTTDAAQPSQEELARGAHTAGHFFF